MRYAMRLLTKSPDSNCGISFPISNTQIRDADERRKKLEQQKLAATTELQAKQEEIKTISNEAERQKALESIQNLESEIRELGKKCDLESVLREELSLEIQTLQRSQAKSSWSVQPVPQEPSQMSLQLETAEPSSFTAQPSSFTAHQAMPATRPVMSPVPPNYTMSPIVYGTTENTTPPTSLRGLSAVQPQAPLSYQSTTSVKYSIEGPIVSEVAVPRNVENPVSNTNQNKGDSSAPMETTNTEINRILARIEQDNRILAELEKSRATVDLPLVPASTNTTREEMSSRERNLSLPSKQSVSRQELEQLMAKLEQDNRILAELDKKRNILESYSSSLSSKSSSFLASNSFAGHLPIMPSPSPSLGSLRDPSASLALQGLTASASSASLHHALVPAGHTLIPTALLQRLAPAEGQHSSSIPRLT
ncbi:hypothetical protein AVEN_63220-1 [Araneus ventricosus]|uniref:Uncharacterized protein n=1 Tax=Araneus ventricosus TaxID=182803 RepID=A0A4Y2B4B7_ARAVE|nr:hypothetical protein AVEN_63220-1 [Araneus ventricosus]